MAPDGKTYTNNIGVKGLFFDTVLDACLDIDYEAKTLRMGLFLDTRDGIGQQVNGKYATYFPGLATKSATAWVSHGFTLRPSSAILIMCGCGSRFLKTLTRSSIRTGQPLMLSFRL